MKYITLMISIFLLISCQNQSRVGNLDYGNMDLSALKKLMNEKQAERNLLEDQIDSIKSRIQELDPAQSRRTAQRVTVLPVEDTVFLHYFTVQGLLDADETIGVNADVNGRIRKLKIREGDYVKKGDQVAELDMDQLTKQKEELLTGYELAKDVYERQKRLWDQNIGSEMQYLQAKNEMERIEKSLETLEYQQSKGMITAPVDGVVDEVFIKEGEIAMPGSPIATILDVRQLKVVADVPENHLGTVSRGEVVDVHFPSLQLDVKGRVILIGSKIDQANRTFKVEIRVPRASPHLKPNLLAEISINDERIENVVTVPINLVQQEINGREFLMVADRSGPEPVARKTYITRGPANLKRVVITSGLSAGDEVIDRGSKSVPDGHLIQVVEQEDVLFSEDKEMIQ